MCKLVMETFFLRRLLIGGHLLLTTNAHSRPSVTTASIPPVDTLNKKVKVGDIALNGTPISEIESVTCRTGSHSVTCQPTQVNAPHLNPSQIGWYSIYLPCEKGKATQALNKVEN